MRIIFLGPPGAGKGTQAQNICKEYGIRQISSGDLLRACIESGTEIGLEAREIMKRGELVPDTMIIDMMRQEMRKPVYNKGFLLDGFPRTIPQAEALDGMLIESNNKLNCVLVLEIPHEVIIERLSLRRTDRKTGRSFHMIYNPPPADGDWDLFQREDDLEDTVRNRLKIYENMTKPLVKYYSSMGLAQKVDGMGSLDEVYKKISKVLDSCNKSFLL